MGDIGQVGMEGVDHLGIKGGTEGDGDLGQVGMRDVDDVVLIIWLTPCSIPRNCLQRNSNTSSHALLYMFPSKIHYLFLEKQKYTPALPLTSSSPNQPTHVEWV